MQNSMTPNILLGIKEGIINNDTNRLLVKDGCFNDDASNTVGVYKYSMRKTPGL